MRSSLDQVLERMPKPEVLIPLEPEELAGLLLKSLQQETRFRRGELLAAGNNAVEDRPQGYRETFLEALNEAWVWLENDGLIAPSPNSENRDWCYITRRGKKVQVSGDWQHYLKARILPKETLHPVIFQKVYSAFLRSEYDTAVFQAFREVEVAVRVAGNFPSDKLGRVLMKEAFRPSTGPLTDSSAAGGEQEALMFLFDGAIGHCKNPSSHRTVPFLQEEAVELLMFASHLLRIVDSRIKANQAT